MSGPAFGDAHWRLFVDLAFPDGGLRRGLGILGPGHERTFYTAQIGCPSAGQAREGTPRVREIADWVLVKGVAIPRDGAAMVADANEGDEHPMQRLGLILVDLEGIMPGIERPGNHYAAFAEDA